MNIPRVLLLCVLHLLPLILCSCSIGYSTSSCYCPSVFQQQLIPSFRVHCNVREKRGNLLVSPSRTRQEQIREASYGIDRKCRRGEVDQGSGTSAIGFCSQIVAFEQLERNVLFERVAYSLFPSFDQCTLGNGITLGQYVLVKCGLDRV